jgi:DNA-binding XRE family transcriptional regulator
VRLACGREGRGDDREGGLTLPAKKSAACITLGKAVRTRRMELGHAQESFARKARMDRSYYGAIERGDIIVKVARALELKAATLFMRAGL